MRLTKLLENIEVKNSFSDYDISEIITDSRKVTECCVFVCIKGREFDGHSAALKAAEKGAKAIISERQTGAPNEILVNSTREALAKMSSAFYGEPSKKMKLIGVTGTNGKTSTTHMIKKILEHCGKKTGLIGTVSYMAGGEMLSSASLTTPKPQELHRIFKSMAESGCEYCVMEVSSQALAQGRCIGLEFSAAVFTNLTQDHLDYHGDFEHYLQAKKRLFQKADIAVLNMDDASASRMTEGLPIKTVTFAVKQDADYTAKNVICTANGVQYELLGRGDIGRVQLKIPGHFTVYNSMGAAICAIEAGLPFEQVCTLLAQSHGVPGRVEVVPTDTEYTVLIDYAHSPDGLENVISSLREVSEKRIITVFGCGGDRDRTKRPKMGKIVGDLADVAVVTSDNPRSENPDSIVQDILAGMDTCKAKIKAITDRTEAIRYALSIAKAGDVVLLAGKGHETYQILNTGKIHYDEREVVAQILKG